MADTMRGSVSITPIVTVTGDSDAADRNVIHHDIKQTLGGNLSWSASQAVATARWYYSAATIVTTTFGDAIGGFSSTTDYTDGTAINTSDEIRMIYVEHLGVDQNGDTSASTDYLGVIPTGGGMTQLSTLLLEPGESIVLKFLLSGGRTIAGLNLDVQANTAQAKVVALCDEVG